jgi:hypothetical protein
MIVKDGISGDHDGHPRAAGEHEHRSSGDLPAKREIERVARSGVGADRIPDDLVAASALGGPISPTRDQKLVGFAMSR